MLIVRAMSSAEPSPTATTSSTHRMLAELLRIQRIWRIDAIRSASRLQLSTKVAQSAGGGTSVAG